MIMSRFTGSNWKVSRRLGYSISETGKELKKTSLCSWSTRPKTYEVK
jgi:hypothetical protein